MATAFSESQFPHSDVAIDYAQRVVKGKQVACKWVILACKRFLHELDKGIDNYWYDDDAAERACRFIELLPHTKGRWAARHELIVLQPWQTFFVCNIFGWVHKRTGLRRFREVYLEVPRKNGKSILAAAIGVYMFVADGEFGAEVYSGATTEKQAWEVFKPARFMVQRTPALKRHYGVLVNASNMVRLDDGSMFSPLIGNPGDGASPSCALIDEYHEHQTSAFYDTMITGMGARDQPLTLIITTAGSNIAGPCYEERKQLEKVLQGVFDNPELFGIVYTIDQEPGAKEMTPEEWGTKEALIKANPNYGVSINDDYLQGRLRDALQSPRRQSIFKAKHLNMWVGARNAWMDMRQWYRAPERKTLQALAGHLCYLPLDLASRRDMAALMLLFPPTEDDPIWYVHGRYYLPEQVVEKEETTNASHYKGWANEGLLTLTPGNVIDYDAIADDIRAYHSLFAVEEVPFDPWQAQHLANDLTDDGVEMVKVSATVGNFSEPMKTLEALVFQRKLAHGGCPVLAWQASNVVARLDKKDNVYPVKEQPENKIDGIVALIMGLGRALVGESGRIEKGFESLD